MPSASPPRTTGTYIFVQACIAGKAVYVEKPACVAIGEGAVMVEAARKHNRVGSGRDLAALWRAAANWGRSFSCEVGSTVANRPRGSAIHPSRHHRLDSTAICGRGLRRRAVD